MIFEIIAEQAQHAALIEPLLDRTFGPDRHVKTVYRLREGVAPLADLCFVAVDPPGELLASLRFWPVRIAHMTAILLGPLAVEPSLQGRGIGRSLVRHGLNRARQLGYSVCVVVGEPEYYGPFGFANATAAGLLLPGPVDPQRFQVLELDPGSLQDLGGLIGRAEAVAPVMRRRTATRQQRGSL